MNTGVCSRQYAGYFTTETFNVTYEAPKPRDSFSVEGLLAALHVTIVVVGGRRFWLFVLVGGPPYILYTYLIYHLYTLCMYTTICMFGGPPAMSKTRPPTTMATMGNMQCFLFRN